MGKYSATSGRPHFTLAPYLGGLPKWCAEPAAAVLDRALGLDGVNDVYSSIPPGLDPQNFARCTLDLVGVDVTMDQASFANIPRTGPCIVVANHPHGAIDGVGMIELLMRHRPDVRVMANHLLENFIELKPIFIGVDPFGSAEAARFNVRAVRRALNWLRDGGLLMMFPGGEVSSFEWRSRRIVDPPWDSGVGWLVEKSGAPVVPAYINGRNSVGFQLAGALHPRLRTMMLGREMLNHRGTVIDVKCAPRIDAETLGLLGDRKAIAPYLRSSCYLVAARSRYRKPLRLRQTTRAREDFADIIEAIEPDKLASEVATLPAAQCLLASGRLEVWFAKSDQIPWLLQEIGRLRELTFRQVGEGTGKQVDLDLYDSYYLHLFVWDRDAREIVGGYRLGEASRLLRRYGHKGLYVSSLFRLAGQLTDEFDEALEVGRSFVRPEHQRNYTSLMLLWKGIAHYVARNPHYRVLFGPVSISNDYHPVSQALIVRFLQHNSMERERASLVKPRRPFRSGGGTARRIDLDVDDLRIISNLMTTVEDSEVGVPVLLRQYLKLNGRILGFNVDSNFSDSIDCLLWVDLAQTDPALLRKYMGGDGAERFLRRHRPEPDAAAQASGE